MTVSLTDIEIRRVLDACNGYIEIMEQGEDTHEYTIYEIETGLGSALRKLYKEKNGQRVYDQFKTVTTYPTFDEWKKKNIIKKANDMGLTFAKNFNGKPYALMDADWIGYFNTFDDVCNYLNNISGKTESEE